VTIPPVVEPLETEPEPALPLASPELDVLESTSELPLLDPLESPEPEELAPVPDDAESLDPLEQPTSPMSRPKRTAVRPMRNDSLTTERGMTSPFFAVTKLTGRQEGESEQTLLKS
jgi:hypothetical protein